MNVITNTLFVIFIIILNQFKQLGGLVSLWQASAGSCRTRRDASSRLFGGLVRSRVSSVNVQLDIPDLPDRADVVIPTFHKPISMEVAAFLSHTP